MNNDLISRSALWTDIMMLPHNGEIIWCDDVEQAIVDAPAVDVGSKWISVKERLPDNLEDVIAFNRNGKITWFSVAYVETRQWWSAGRMVHHVTHWMHLPEPPKSVT